MNWKLIGVLAVGAGLLSACGAANQTPTATGDRETTTDPGGTVKKDNTTPPTEKKDPAPTNDAVMHE